MHAQGTALPAGQGVSRRDQAQDEPIAYTVAKVAQLLGKHPNTIYEWVAKGVLPHQRIGNTIYIPKWALTGLFAPAAPSESASAAPTGGEGRMTATTAVPDTSPSPRVDPAAAVELVGLVQQQMGRLITEHQRGATTQPNLAYQLAGALERLLRDLPVHRALDADAVEQVRWSVRVGRRLDMTDAFNRLNPTFGVRAEHGCWDAVPAQRARRAAVRRRELELAMGGRFARMLVPRRGR
jgi:excisionase family DNA binding protein